MRGLVMIATEQSIIDSNDGKLSITTARKQRDAEKLEQPLKTRPSDVRMYVKHRDGSDSIGRVVNERMFLGAG